MTECEDCKYCDCDTGCCSVKMMVIVSKDGTRNVFFCGKTDEDLE